MSSEIGQVAARCTEGGHRCPASRLFVVVTAAVQHSARSRLGYRRSWVLRCPGDRPGQRAPHWALDGHVDCYGLIWMFMKFRADRLRGRWGTVEGPLR